MYSYTIGLNIFAIIVRIEKYRSTIKKNKNKCIERAVLEKTNLN